MKNNINGHDLSGFLGKFGSLVYWEGLVVWVSGFFFMYADIIGV